MSISKPIAALAAGCLSARASPHWPRPAGPPSRPAIPGSRPLVLDELATIDWIEKSDVAALREGVIEKMELQIGMPVKKGGTIGVLHHEIAELTVAKAKLRPRASPPRRRPRPRRRSPLSVVARNKRLNERKPGMVSAEDVAKAEGELKVADAMVNEAKENQAIAKAELDLAKQTLDEHTIVAPFDGIVIKRMKHPGESVRANEAVVQLGNLDKLRADAYVPLDYAYRVKEGQIVEIQPRLSGVAASRCRSRRSGSGARSPSSIPRSSRSPRPRSGSAPSSRTPDASCGPGLKGADDHLPDPGRSPRPPPADGGRTRPRTSLTATAKSIGQDRGGAGHGSGGPTHRARSHTTRRLDRRTTNAEGCRPMSAAPTLAPAMPFGQAAEHLQVKLRPDLVVQPQFYEGMTHYVIKDPLALKYFRFKIEEYFLLQQFDGKQTLQDVKKAFERKYRPQTISIEDLTRFVAQLHEAGIIQIDSPEQAKVLIRRRKKNRWRKVWQFLANILFIKIPIIDPERLLTGMYPVLPLDLHPHVHHGQRRRRCSLAVTLVVSQWKTFYDKLPDFQSFFNWWTII